jgi:hypothetical protein
MKTKFIIFNNEYNLNSLKNEAKKIKKTSDKKLSEIQNELSVGCTGLPLNKAINKYTSLSPYLENNILYFPFSYNNQNFNVFLFQNENDIVINGDDNYGNLSSLYLDIKNETFDAKYNNLEKIDNGWIISLSGEVNNFLEVKMTDEGIVLDHWKNDEVFNSTWIMFDEIVIDKESGLYLSLKEYCIDCLTNDGAMPVEFEYEDIVYSWDEYHKYLTEEDYKLFDSLYKN